MPFRRAYQVLGLLLILLSGCATQRGSFAPQQLELSVREAPQGVLDATVRNQSAAMHAYLLGQLAYGDENLELAIRRLKESSELHGSPQPVLNEQLAALYVRQGDLPRALAESSRALEAQGGDVETLLYHAGILEALGKQDDAIAAYQRTIEKQLPSIDPYIHLAGLYALLGRSKEQIETLKLSVRRLPQEGTLHFSLGRALEQQQDLTSAIESYRTAARLDPDNVPLGLNFLRALIKAKRKQDAVGLVKILLQKEPSNPFLSKIEQDLKAGKVELGGPLQELDNALLAQDEAADTGFRLGFLHLQRQEMGAAVREFSLLLARNPKNSQARYQLGAVFAGAGRVEDGLRELEKIPVGDEMYLKSRTFAAFVLRQRGDLARAQEVTREALAAEPKNRQILSYLVLILREAKEYREAARLLESAIEDEPQNERLLFNYGLVLSDLGKEREALEMMERVIALDPNQSDALNFVSYGIVQTGDSAKLDRALELIQRALAVRPNDPYYLDTLGWIYFQQGKYAEAEETLAKVVSAVNDDPVLFEHYGEVLLKRGEIERARQVFRSALERGMGKDEPEQRKSLERMRGRLQELGGAAGR